MSLIPMRPESQKLHQYMELVWDQLFSWNKYRILPLSRRGHLTAVSSVSLEAEVQASVQLLRVFQRRFLLMVSQPG